MDAQLGRRDQERVRFLVENIQQALAPSNVPLLNPASAKAVVDTAGLSLLRGGRNLLRDMASAPRVPEMVDGSSFEVGRNVAATAGAVVLRTEILELIQYRPLTETVREVPLLIVPPTINKHYAHGPGPGPEPGRVPRPTGPTGVHDLLAEPRRPAREWGLDTYVQAVLDALTRSSRSAASTDGTGRRVFGRHHRQPGRGSTGRHRQESRLAAFTLLVTVLDNAQAGLTAALIDPSVAAAAKLVSKRRGYLDGRALAEVFAWLRPGDLIWNYWVNNYLLGKNPPAFDILFWNADTTRMPAQLHADFVDFAMGNKIVNPGGVTAVGRADRPVAGARGHLHRGRDHRPHHPVAELLPQHPAARRRDPFRAVHQRAHRRAGQPADQPQGDLPGQHRQPGRRRRNGSPTADTDRAAGGPTSRTGSASAAGRNGAHPPNWAAAATGRSTDAPGTYVFEN